MRPALPKIQNWRDCAHGGAEETLNYYQSWLYSTGSFSLSRMTRSLFKLWHQGCMRGQRAGESERATCVCVLFAFLADRERAHATNYNASSCATWARKTRKVNEETPTENRLWFIHSEGCAMNEFWKRAPLFSCFWFPLYTFYVSWNNSKKRNALHESDIDFFHLFLWHVRIFVRQRFLCSSNK